MFHLASMCWSRPSCDSTLTSNFPLRTVDIDIALDDMLGCEFADRLNEYLTMHAVGVVLKNPEKSKHLETAPMKVASFCIDFINLRAEAYTQDCHIPDLMRIGTAEEDALSYFWHTSQLAVSHDNPNEPAGYAKSHSNLDFVLVYDSGHLVPYNQPANALDLLRRFVDKKSFYDHKLPNFGDYVDHMSIGTTKSGPTTMLSQASVILDASSLRQASTETVMYGFSVLPTIMVFLVGFGLTYLWQQQNTKAR